MTTTPGEAAPDDAVEQPAPTRDGALRDELPDELPLGLPLEADEADAADQAHVDEDDEEERR